MTDSTTPCPRCSRELIRVREEGYAPGKVMAPEHVQWFSSYLHWERAGSIGLPPLLPETPIYIDCPACEGTGIEASPPPRTFTTEWTNADPRPLVTKDDCIYLWWSKIDFHTTGRVNAVTGAVDYQGGVHPPGEPWPADLYWTRLPKVDEAQPSPKPTDAGLCPDCAGEGRGCANCGNPASECDCCLEAQMINGCTTCDGTGHLAPMTIEGAPPEERHA